MTAHPALNDMSTDDPRPSRIVGGGINTGESEQPVVVTQMLGIDNNDPVREEILRARFFSFDPLFDAGLQSGRPSAGPARPTAPADAPPELRQMEEDMLLTGLYSLTQGGLTGPLPLLVRISTGGAVQRYSAATQPAAADLVRGHRQ
jgi:hypothetical protein